MEEPDCEKLLNAGIGLAVGGICGIILTNYYFGGENSNMANNLRKVGYTFVGVGAVLIVSAESGTGCRE
jgi:hypothetical protein